MTWYHYVVLFFLILSACWALITMVFVLREWPKQIDLYFEDRGGDLFYGEVPSGNPFYVQFTETGIEIDNRFLTERETKCVLKALS